MGMPAGKPRHGGRENGYGAFALRTFIPELPELVEVGVVMDEAKVVVLSAGEDHKVGCRHCDAPAARQSCKIAGTAPDLRDRRNGFKLLLQFAEQPMILRAPGTVPQLDAHQIAEHGPIIGRDLADPGPYGRIAVRPERFDPGRCIDEESPACAQGSSRIRRSSSWVMNPSRVPNLAASF